MQRKLLGNWFRPMLVTHQCQSRSVTAVSFRKNPQKGSSGQCSEPQALREVLRSQPQLARIPGYPARAIRGMRNRSQRCSAQRLILSRNEKPLCVSLGSFTDELQVQCGGKHGAHTPHLQLSSGSLTRRGQRSSQVSPGDRQCFGGCCESVRYKGNMLDLFC